MTDMPTSDAIDRDVDVIAVHVRDDGHPGVVATAAPPLGWRLHARRSDVRQIAYEIDVAADPRFERRAGSSGRIASSMPVAEEWPAPLMVSRERRWVRVRIWTDQGVTDWSNGLSLEAALLDPQDWSARPISPVENLNQRLPCPAPLLRRSFVIDRDVAEARLYITALGVQDSWINGHRVGDALLEPGWTAYQQRLPYAVHDVTSLLQPGENVLAGAVGDGWWRGWLTWMGKRGVYGETTALIAQLEIRFADGSELVIASDDTWRGSTGAVRMADLYNGVETDLRREPAGWKLPGFDDTGWGTVAMLERPAGLTLRPMPPVRVVERWAASVTKDGEGVTRIDTRQNLAGFLRLRVRGHAGARLVVRHAEMLDDHGRLYTAPLRRAEATDRYTLADNDEVVLEPTFTFHGFRYAEIVADAGVEIVEVEVCAISSDLRRTASFDCSDPRLNQLFDNVRWSQLGNFVALPTDCPQRDERLGWTGDIQVFAQTACALSDCRSFLSNWLDDLAVEQRADGNVPSTVPNVLAGFEYEYGGVGWGDAATLVPWALFEAFGDKVALRNRFDSMRAWVDFGASRRGTDGTWSGDFQLGDWLDPGADPTTPEKATTDGGFIATAYLAHSARTLARAAAILGRGADEAQYAALSQDAAAAAWRRWRDHAITTQAGCAIALEFGIAPPDDMSMIADALAELVDRNDGRIGTGFLGTPLVLPALARAGKIDAAYRLLLNDRCPGWLYQVARGATTMWERWDAVQEDGSLHGGAMAIGEDSSMISFNHYAYGAVATWLLRGVAGIAPDAADPGYGTIRFAPKPGGGLTHAKASIDTPRGPASIAWRIENGWMTVALDVPPGAVALFEVPSGWRSAAAISQLGSGQHALLIDQGDTPAAGP